MSMASSPRSRSTLAVVATAFAVAGGVVGGGAACSSQPPPSLLRQTGDSLNAGALPNVVVGRSYVFYLGSMCVSGAPVRITDVRTVPADSAIRIVDWGFRYRFLGDTYSMNNGDPGALPGTLAALRGFTRGPVTVSCSAHKDTPQVTTTEVSDEFDVEVQLTRSGVGRSSSFAVAYSSGGVGRVATQHYAMTLCSASCPGFR